MKIHHSIAASVVMLAVAGCAQIAVVSEKHPAALPLTSDAYRVATQTINRALVEEKKQPIVALGAFVAAARDALHQLDRNPANAEARRDYTFAVARIFTVVRDAKLDPWTRPMRVGSNGEFTLTWKRDPRPEWNLALYDLIPAHELDFKGTYVKDHVTKEGIGAPLAYLLVYRVGPSFCCRPPRKTDSVRNFGGLGQPFRTSRSSQGTSHYVFC